jgi:molecular chaperone HscB
MNHFELFELPYQFELDGSSLSSTFRELQRQYHPDNVASQDDKTRLQAVQKASQINDAFQTLKDPVSRAEYMLLLQGIDLKDEQQTMQDPEFLMQQMMLREELESITDSHDDAALFDFGEKVQALYDSLIADVKTALAQSQWQDAAVIVRKLKFAVKLRQEVERVEDQLMG